LFNILSVKLAERINNLHDGIQVGGVMISGIFYADDICTVATSRGALKQREIIKNIPRRVKIYKKKKGKTGIMFVFLHICLYLAKQ